MKRDWSYGLVVPDVERSTYLTEMHFKENYDVSYECSLLSA